MKAVFCFCLFIRNRIGHQGSSLSNLLKVKHTKSYTGFSGTTHIPKTKHTHKSLSSYKCAKSTQDLCVALLPADDDVFNEGEKRGTLDSCSMAVAYQSTKLELDQTLLYKIQKPISLDSYRTRDCVVQG